MCNKKQCPCDYGICDECEDYEPREQPVPDDKYIWIDDFLDNFFKNIKEKS